MFKYLFIVRVQFGLLKILTILTFTYIKIKILGTEK